MSITHVSNLFAFLLKYSPTLTIVRLLKIIFAKKPKATVLPAQLRNDVTFKIIMTDRNLLRDLTCVCTYNIHYQVIFRSQRHAVI